MTLLLGVPAVASLAALLISWNWSTRSRADHAARALTATLVATCTTVIVAASLYAVAWMVPAERAIWCRRMLGHSADHRPVAGVILFAVVMIVLTRGTMITRRIVRIWKAETLGRSPISVEESDQPYAFAVPRVFPKCHGHGRGSIVVSTAMLSGLTAQEQSALFAHEQAHLHFGHHRYLLTGRIVAAVAPPLRPMIHRLYWLLDRWADEAAALHVGDREVVATAIAHAALSSGTLPASAFLAFTSDSVVTRVEALFEPPRTRLGVANTMLCLAATSSIVALGTQIHHLVGLVQQMAH
jgi:hypothetical protein